MTDAPGHVLGRSAAAARRLAIRDAACAEASLPPGRGTFRVAAEA